MIRIKVYKLSQLIKAGVVALLVIAAVIAGVLLISSNSDHNAQTENDMEVSTKLDAPAFADKSSTDLTAKAEQLLKWQLPLAPQAVPVTAETEQADEPDDPDRIHVQISRIEGSYEPALNKDKPRVLIYHTHSYEAYAQNPNDLYEETTQWRTEDSEHNIMAIGTAYVRSLKTLQNYADQGECFDMMIDLHRDAASVRNTNPSTVLVDGKSCARLMMLIGTGEGSEGNRFSIVPNWEENYKLAQALTDKLNEDNPDICREVMVKTGRYNQHMSESAILIEVGHNENTLEEALRAAKPLAISIAAILKGDG